MNDSGPSAGSADHVPGSATSVFGPGTMVAGPEIEGSDTFTGAVAAFAGTATPSAAMHAPTNTNTLLTPRKFSARVQPQISLRRIIYASLLPRRQRR